MTRRGGERGGAPFAKRVRAAVLGVLAMGAAACGVRMDGPSGSASSPGAASGAGSAGAKASAGATVSGSAGASANASADASGGVAAKGALGPPACAESAVEPGAWGRAESGAAGIVKVTAGVDGKSLGALTQAIEGQGRVRLRFLGTHVFDLLDKLHGEGGATEAEKRRVICAVLDEVAKRGAPVVRLWGTLKRTGSTEEIERARELLALVLDENARRNKPLRFVVTLLNHQPGYGLPDPAASLDDQKAAGWSARDVYTSGAWRRRGIGQLAERIERYRGDKAIRESPYILAWELVNELDTHRSVAGGTFYGPEAEALQASFLVPAAKMLAESFPQPLALGDLRGVLAGYAAFGESVVRELPPEVRARLVWTAHVYTETTTPPPAASAQKALLEKATRKLDLDLDLARKMGLPFFMGEIGQLVRNAKTSYCKGGTTHDIAALLEGVLSPQPDPRARRDIDGVLFWGEGLCALNIPSPETATLTLDIGAGGDSADLGPTETPAREALSTARRSPRFLAR